MDKFIVSARKYRPQAFDTVVGQAHITTTLKNAIKNQQLAHAFLFCGPRGVGKTTCARILAKTINCENQQPDGEACNTCHSCTSFNDGTSLNIHELDAASNNSVDDIRSLVDQVRFAPQAGKYKVYIIDEVHMLSSSAFNAFLKTLEEPPPYAIFILATTEKHKILPTILSRCQIFDFKRITTSDTVEHLEKITQKEHITAEKPALHVIAQKSEGCMRDALSILDKIVSFTNGEVSYSHTLEHLNILDEDYYFRLINNMLSQDLAESMLLFDDINSKGFDEELVLNGFSEFIRNLLICKDERTATLLDVVENFKDKYKSTAQKMSSGYLISALNILNETEISFKAARNKRLHIELAIIRLTYLLQALELVSNNDGLGKKKITESAKPVAFKKIQPLKLSSKSEKKPESKHTASDEENSIKNTSASLHIDDKVNPSRDTPVVSGNKASQKASETAKSLPTGLGRNQLDKLRRQIAEEVNGQTEKRQVPLSKDKLTEAWQQFADKLRENKNPAVQSFELAVLEILSENSFEVMANNNLEQKFIEQEKRVVSEYLQEFFGDKTLHFSVKVSEKPVEFVETDKTLSKKDQYLLMIKEFPIIKELKDGLKLELDY